MPAPRPTFSATINDSTGQSSQTLDGLQKSVLRAASDWGNYLVSSANLNINVEIGGATIGTANGGSTSYQNVGNDGGKYFVEGSAPYTLINGTGTSGSASDISIYVDPAYIKNSLWFDPDPGNDIVPSDKTNADEVFAHEIGHALGFIGFRDANSGQLGQFETGFDQHTAFDGTNAFFTGDSAEAAYGGPVPLTFSDHNPENFYHYANQNGPGQDLISGLMSGVGHFPGPQVVISDLDIAMLSDSGCPIGVKNNGTSGADEIVAGMLPAVTNLYQGNDAFDGSSAGDFVFGGRGDDVIFGEDGNDLISGGPGSNTLAGGSGADTFAVRVPGASDLILDFSPDEGDSLKLENQNYSFGVATDGSLLVNLSGGGSVTLAGVDPGRAGSISISTGVI